MNDAMMPQQILNPGYQHQHHTFIRGQGNYLFTTQDIPFIDMAMGAGSLIFGHAPEKITRAIQAQCANGTLFMQNNPYVQDLSQEVQSRTPEGLKHHVYCNTGSEATQRAIRLARAATGKSHVASFQGGWHGMNEWTLLDDGGRFSLGNIKPYTGIPEAILDHSILLPYNDDSAFETIRKNADKLAAIIIEPVQGSNPQPEIKPYLSRLIGLCKELNILVIFDEVITGFRVHPGGATALFELAPDIVTYGKVLGGGLPIGLVAFSEQVYKNTFARPEKNILTGGTFSANPLAAVAGLTTLKELNQRHYSLLEKISTHLKSECNDMFKKASIPFRIDGLSSFNRLYFTSQKVHSRAHRDKLELSPEKQALFRQLLWQERVIWPANGILCCATTQDEQFIDTLIPIIKKAALAVI